MVLTRKYLSENSTRPSGPDSAFPAAGDESLLRLRGIGPARQRLLAKLGINRPEDALLHLPLRYEDRRFAPAIEGVNSGAVALKGTVLSSRTFPGGQGRKAVFEVKVAAGDQVLTARWFHAWRMTRSPVFRKGKEIALYGDLTVTAGGPSMVHPDVEETDGSPSANFGRIVPVYPSVDGLSQRVLRGLMTEMLAAALPGVRETLPPGISARLGLPSRREALATLHHPPGEFSPDLLASPKSPWRRRLAFEELLLLQLGLTRRRALDRSRKKPRPRKGEGDMIPRLRAALPFRLTEAQERVYAGIAADMAAPSPMRRLLQGDVGSGKTVVAAMAVGRAIDGGCQAAMMVPTELLAEQHTAVLDGLLSPLGVRVALLAAGQEGKARAETKAGLAAGEIDCVVGTHALIQRDVTFHRLGLALIDEQHRFGVRQRLALKEKGIEPDLLAMTATPIPRTLCLAFYGDFDLSVLDEMPPGRRPVRTEVREENERGALLEEVKSEIDGGNRVFMVLPAIEEGGRAELRAARETARHLQDHVFPDLCIALLHGRMNYLDRRETMARFRRGEIQLLVATTVIEVGVDVPEATLLVVEHADRFGLSQLHQLRGRVGRGDTGARCILMVSPGAGEEARRRLAVITAESDGFRIAEADLAIRGPGEILGTKQSGLPTLRVADLAADADLLLLARKEAEGLMTGDGNLSSPDNRELRRAVNAAWKGKFPLAAAG